MVTVPHTHTRARISRSRRVSEGYFKDVLGKHTDVFRRSLCLGTKAVITLKERERDTHTHVKDRQTEKERQSEGDAQK